MFQLRPYQESVVHGIRTAFADGYRRVLVVCPTGGGKGVIAAAIMAMTAAKQNSCNFFADQRELNDQLAKHLEGADLPYEMVMAGRKNEYQSVEEFDQAQFCRLIAKDTLWARRNKMEFPPAHVVQVDEAHKSLAKTWTTVIETYSGALVIGWTATPCRTDGKPLGDFYDKLVLGPTYSQLQKDGFLVPVRCWAPNRPDLKGLKISRGDYTKGALEERMNRSQMVGSIIDEWKRNANDRYTFAFACGLGHSTHIRDEFRRIGVSAETVDGKMGQRQREDILGKARDGRIQVLCNYGVLTTGVDLPRFKYLICARPTKSFSLWRQMGGRIQRPWEDHDHCFIQDHSDNAINFGYPDEDVEWVIDGDKPIELLHQEQRERNERDEREAPERLCGNCAKKFVGRTCPRCGWNWEPPPEEIKMSKAELKELERKRLNREASIGDKQRYWDECFQKAMGRRMSMKAVCGMYKDRFGVFPCSDIRDVPRGYNEWQLSARQYWAEVVGPRRKHEQDKAQSVMF